MKSLKHYITHPYAATTAILGALATLLGVVPLDPLLAFLGAIWATSGTSFTTVSIFAFTVGPEVQSLEPYLPVLRGLAVGLGVLYGIRKLLTLIDRFKENLKE